MKKPLLLLLTLIFCIALASCGGKEEEPQKYNIVFESNGGSAVSTITRDEGTSVAKPADPYRNNHIFLGWYLNSELTESVAWPLTLNSDLKVFAEWIDNKTYFLNARDNTVNASGFEYDFTLALDLAYGTIDGPSANIEGNVKYNQSAQHSYYKNENTSGLLLPNNTIHIIKTNNELATFKVNSKGTLFSYEKEAVDSNFKYESSIYAKVLFNYDASQIESVTKKSDGSFEIKYVGGSSNFIKSLLQALDSPLLAAFIDLPNLDSDLQIVVTMENGLIKSFNYSFSIGIVAGTLSVQFQLIFKKVGSGVNIVPPSFPGIAITESEITQKANSINTLLTAYQAENRSGYTYDVKTEVKFPDKNAINAHVQGRTMRVVEANEDVYFWNRIELDSDYKNSDLYKNLGIEDYERYRVTYQNGDVYDCIDGVFSNTYTKIEGYDNHAIDNYYFFIPLTLLNKKNISIIQEKNQGAAKTYSLGLNATGVTSLLGFIDQAIRIDVNNENEFLIYNIKGELEITGCEFIVEIENNKLKSIKMEIEGSYNANPYQGTEFGGNCTFKLNYELITNTLANDYQIPANDKDVDLSNS